MRTILTAGVLSVVMTNVAASASLDFGTEGNVAPLSIQMFVLDRDFSAPPGSKQIRSDVTYGDIRGTGTLDGLDVTLIDVRLGPFDIATSGASTFTAWSDGAWREYAFSFTAKASTSIAFDDFSASIKPHSPTSSTGYAENGEYLQSTLDEPIVIEWSIQGPETLVSGTELLRADRVTAPSSYAKGQWFRFAGSSWEGITFASSTGQSTVFDGTLDGADLRAFVLFSTSARLVPEPSSVVLLLVGCAGLIRFARPLGSDVQSW